MGRLGSLVKAMMSGGLQVFNYQAKSGKAKRIMPLFLGVLIGLVMLIGASTTTTELAKDGAQLAILPLYTLITAIVIVVEGSYKAGDLLFRSRDNDMLLAMPIKKSTIVLARMLRFYLFEMVYCMIFLLPAVIAYAMSVEVGAMFWVVAITMLILVPVIPIAIACIMGMVITMLSGRFRHGVLLQVASSFVMMFLIVGAVFAMNTTSDFDGRNMVAISDVAARFYYPAAVFAGLVKQFELGGYLLFVLVNIVVVAATALVISWFCPRIITRPMVVKWVDSRGKRYAFERHSQVVAMMKKEMTRYFSTPVLLVNTAMGLVFFVIAVGVLCFKFDDFAGSLVATSEDFPLTVEEMRMFMPGVTFAMVAFASLLTCITATMISLEGKTFNMLKTLPISGRKVLATKALAATALIVPVTLVGWLVMCLRFQFGVLDAVLVLIGVVAMPLATELIGILINLGRPRFDADSDAVVVRQSASVMVATFLGLMMVLATISLTFATVWLAGQTAGLAMMDAVYVVMVLLLCLAVATRGDEKYLKLAA